MSNRQINTGAATPTAFETDKWQELQQTTDAGKGKTQHLTDLREESIKREHLRHKHQPP
ncbi:hypothetical protein CXB51_013583 [Gossypium anomalum]|uniref:Uncharacterized protein n=1 Tax=Gossypium anomalum TaxID=47600 RepID=A0A8J6D948_9ROSI|nr:hypothetical protein CXB51_013583 [Gossypium anomalum]